MAITFDNPASRSAYSWIGEWQLNPNWNGIDPETKYLKDPVTGKFIPKNLNISKSDLWRTTYINDVNGNWLPTGQPDANGNPITNWKPVLDANGNLVLSAINAPVIDKDWTFALANDPKIPNQTNIAPPHSVDLTKVQKIFQQWNNVIDFTGQNKNVSFAYVDGQGTNLEGSSGRTYVGSDGTRNVIFLNSNPAQYDIGIKTSNISLVVPWITH